MLVMKRKKDREIAGSKSYQSSGTSLIRGTKVPKTLVLLRFGEGQIIRD